jgi:hypothetical protein
MAYTAVRYNGSYGVALDGRVIASPMSEAAAIWRAGLFNREIAMIPDSKGFPAPSPQVRGPAQPGAGPQGGASTPCDGSTRREAAPDNSMSKKEGGGPESKIAN